jgi:hypothetical protein
MLPNLFVQRINVGICYVGRLEVVVFSATKRTSFDVVLSRAIYRSSPLKSRLGVVYCKFHNATHMRSL